MLRVQRRLAAQLLKCGKNRVWLDPDRMSDIKEAITKADVGALIKIGAVSKKELRSSSRFWARAIKEQKKRGKRKGQGSRKGKKTARTPSKRAWMNKIRLQRGFIKNLRDKGSISSASYHELYMKSKGGFFRSIRHLKLYTQERDMIKK